MILATVTWICDTPWSTHNICIISRNQALGERSCMVTLGYVVFCAIACDISEMYRHWWVWPACRRNPAAYYEHRNLLYCWLFNTTNTHVFCKITLSAPLNSIWIQATCAFFSLHGVKVESVAIVPHTPPIHISTLPALERSIEPAWARRSWPSCEQLTPMAACVKKSFRPDKLDQTWYCLQSSKCWSPILIVLMLEDEWIHSEKGISNLNSGTKEQ